MQEKFSTKEIEVNSPVTVEAPKAEIIAPKVVKKADKVKKVLRVIQKKPKTFKLQLQGGEVVEVSKANFDKASMSIK